jgi:energy-coupling factor transporter ATP-binding protein EcfA2
MNSTNMENITLKKFVDRAAREAIQRSCAAKREKQAWKSLSKKEREAAIRGERIYKCDLPQEEGGLKPLYFGAGLAATAAGIHMAGGFEGCYNGATSVVRTARTIASIPEEVHAAIASARRATEVTASLVTASAPVVQSVVGISSILNKAFESISAFFDKMRDTAGLLYQFICAAFLWALKCSKIAHGILAALCEWVKTRCGVDARVTEIISPTEGVEEQSGMSTVSFFAVLVATLWMPDVKSERVVPELMRRVSVAEKSGSGLEWIFTQALSILDSVINCALRMLGKEEICLVGQVEKEIRQWTKKVDDIQAMVISGNPTPEQVRESLIVAQEGVGLKNRIHAYAHRMHLDRYLDKLYSWMQAHRGAIMASKCYRQQPLFALFGGASGIGKTTCLVMLAGTVAMLGGLVKDGRILEQMWQKGDSQFWNGYMGQSVYIMDDCFQRRTQPGAEGNEGMSLISAVNSWAYPLNFADVESKGRFYFDSQLMLGTTNEYNVLDAVSGDVRHPEAVVRRIAFGYVMRVNPEGGFALPNGRLNYEKLQLERVKRLATVLQDPSHTLDDICQSFPWEAWQVSKHDFRGHPSESEWEPLYPVVKRMAADLKDRSVRHASEVTELEKYAAIVAEYARKNQQLPEAQAGLGRSHEIEAISDEEDDPVLSDGLFPMTLSKTTGDVEFVPFAEKLAAIAKMVLTGFTALLGAYSLYVVGSALMSTIHRVITFVCDTVRGLVSLVWDSVKWLLFGEVTEQSVHNEGIVKPEATKYKRPMPKEQLGSPPEDRRQDITYANTYKVVVGDESLGQALFVRDTLCLMPHHFKLALEHQDPDEEVLFVSAAQSRHTLKLTVAQLMGFKSTVYEDSDLWFLEMGRGCVKAHRDIVGYFIPEKGVSQVLSKKGNVPVRLDVARYRNIGGKHDLDRHVFLSNECVYGTDLVYASGRSVDTYFRYKAPTQAGDCGAPLMIAEARHWGGCILGIHVAGRTDMLARHGYATIVCRETVEEVCKAHKMIEDRFVEDLAANGISLEPLTPEQLLAHEQTGLIAGSFIPLGKIPLEYGVSLPIETKLKPSGYEGHGDPVRLPAKLRPFYDPSAGKMVIPMVKAVTPYQSALIYKPVPRMASIVAMAMKKHWSLTEKSFRGLFSVEEAVLGIEGLKGKKVPRDTSSGFPWSKKYGTGKHAFFGTDDDYKLEGAAWEDLKASVLRVVDSAKNGVRLAHIATDFLKDELRTPAKVAAGATRLISGCSVSYTIAVRMYFYAFLVSMFETHTESGMAPGINTYTEWFKIGDTVGRFKKVFAGDFGAFDSSEQPYVHNEILNYINRWYRHNNSEWTEEDDLVRKVLFEDLVHSRHLTGESGVATTIVQWNKSLPSGHPLTTAVNSMYSLITLTACYAKATGDYTDMWSNAYIVTYGDDNVQGVSDPVSEVFNQVTVARDMKEDFDLTYTSEKKDGTLVPTTTLDDVGFLKRGIIRDPEAPGGWVAPLDPASFLYSPYWFRNNRSGIQEVGVNLQKLVEEAALHPAEDWERLTRPAYEWAADNGVELLCYSREHARDIVFSRSDNWY